MFSAWTIKAVTIALILVFIKWIRDVMLGKIKRDKKASLDNFRTYCTKRTGKAGRIVSMDPKL